MGRSGRVALALIACVGWGATPAAAEPGDRDPSFGPDATGKDLQTFGAGTIYRDVVAAPDGGLLVTGRTSYTTAGPLSPLFVARYTPEGRLDPAFGSGGVFRANLGDTGIEGHALAVDSLGRILVAGRVGGGDPVVVRVTPGGTLDTAFGGGDGKSEIIDLEGDATLVGIGVGPDDRPVIGSRTFVAGESRSTVQRWTTAGVADPAFSADGRITFPNSEMTDLTVDAAGRPLFVRGSSGTVAVRRLSATGGIDPSFDGGTVTLPEAAEGDDGKLAISGGSILVATRTQNGTTANVRLVKLSDGGVLDTAWGGGDGVGMAGLPFRNATALSGLAPLTGMRSVALLRTTGAISQAGSPNPAKLTLIRFDGAGEPDRTFRPSVSPTYSTTDGLGLPDDYAILAGGIARVADDRVVVAGGTDGDSADDHGFLARYGAPGSRPTARLNRTYDPVGDPPSQRDYARPGQHVTLDASGSTDPDGPISSFAWDVFAAPGFETAGGAILRPSLAAGDYPVSVLVRDETGLDDTAATLVRVRENQAPTLELNLSQDSWQPDGVPEQIFEDRPTIFFARAADPDGRVTKVEWDIDEVEGFEHGGAATYRSYLESGTYQVSARATDDEGRQTTKIATVKVVKPPCADQSTVTIGRLRAIAACWKKDISGDGKTTTWTAQRPLPALNGDPPAASGLQLSNVQDLEVSYVGKPQINGLSVVAYDVLQIVDRTGKPDLVQMTDARVETVGPAASRFLLTDGAVLDTWRLEGNKLTSVGARGRYAGLDVGELVGDAIELPAVGAARLKFYPLLPAVLGGVSSDELVTVNTGAGSASSAQSGTECFRANSASLPGLDFLQNLGSVNVCRDAGTADRWTIDVKVDLDQFTGGVFPGLPKVRLQAEIVNGALAAAAARGEWDADNGFPLIGPVFLTGIDFQLLLQQSSFVKPECVPRTGVEVKSLQSLRDLLISSGLPAEDVYALVPDFKYDYGHPSSALCGGVDFRVGMPEITLARGSIDLGVANYDDGRPDAFRMLGKARVLDLVDLDAEAAVYSNGFMDMRVRGYAELLDFLSLEARFNLSVDAPGKRFNAQAYVEGCITPVDFCAGLRAVLSSKGIGACLLLSFFGADWEPGAVYSWRNGLDVYFSGCDLGDIRVNFSGNGSTIITPVQVAPPASRSFRGRVGTVGVAAQAKGSQGITVRSGLPGVYVAVRGQDGALPKFTLAGPRGERVTVDGTASPKPVRSAGWQILHDRTKGISHVFVGKPSGGSWTVAADAGSVPIVEVVSSEGLSGPGVKARITGKGRARELVWSAPARKGQAVRFEERGPTGKQLLGRAVGARGRLAFTSAPGRSEKRSVWAVVEQDGMLREELEVASYRAPATGRPSRPGRVVVRRDTRRSRLDVRWLPARAVRSYELVARLDDGRVMRRTLRGRRVVLRSVPRGVGGTVRVRGVNEVGQLGKTTVVKVKPLKPLVKKKKKTPAKRRPSGTGSR